MELREQVRAAIAEGLPDARVEVRDLTGEGRAFAVDVASSTFEGMRLLEQHRAVMNLLRAHLDDAVHAVQITTSTPSAAAGGR